MILVDVLLDLLSSVWRGPIRCPPPLPRRVLFVHSVVASSPLDCDLIG